MKKIRYDISLWGESDIYLFRDGTHTSLYEVLGSKKVYQNGVYGVYFAVWAPNAKSVSVVGDFNSYMAGLHPLKLRSDGTGVWEGFIESLPEGLTYKYHITSYDDSVKIKSDPFAYYNEKAPKTASIIYDIDGFVWSDEEWMQNRYSKHSHNQPINIYQVHLGSWKREIEDNNRPLTYREIAEDLAKYLVEMNYTHVELMPITEYSYDGSWGYQPTGYFAPTSRYGTPHEFMLFVDTMHSYGIGVIIDWVASHFAIEGHGLYQFDGMPLYEKPSPNYSERGKALFDYSKNEVRAFLISSAMFWFKKYHIDGIRLDDISTMLYMDYDKNNPILPDRFSGKENVDAIRFLRDLNQSLHIENRGILTIAQESTNFPIVSHPTYMGGLGFGYKWNMRWIKDILKYFKHQPNDRSKYHHYLTFGFVYMFSESYILPLSYEEVVPMSGSLIEKMPGDEAQKFANLRSLFAFVMAHPGKKLLFMGGEFGQLSEWDYQNSLEWELLEEKSHKQLKEMVSKLNSLYLNEEALYRYDCQTQGFEWIDELDYQHSVISFIRKGDSEDEDIIVICRFSDKDNYSYRVGVPKDSTYIEIFNSQDSKFGGILDNEDNQIYQSENIECHNKEASIVVDLAPLSVVYLKRVKK